MSDCQPVMHELIDLPDRDSVFRMDLNPYARYLAGAEPVSVMQQTSARLNHLLSPLTTEQTSLQPAPGKWSIREIVAHLADCEVVFAFRLRQALSLDHATLQPFDQEIWADRYAAYDLSSALTLFHASRAWNLLLLANISAADRQRPVTHPERGTMIFWTIPETMAGHDLNHLGQIERLASSFVGDPSPS